MQGVDGRAKVNDGTCGVNDSAHGIDGRARVDDGMCGAACCLCCTVRREVSTPANLWYTELTWLVLTEGITPAAAATPVLTTLATLMHVLSW
jgi:hypothetical protein